MSGSICPVDPSVCFPCRRRCPFSSAFTRDYCSGDDAASRGRNRTGSRKTSKTGHRGIPAASAWWRPEPQTFRCCRRSAKSRARWTIRRMSSVIGWRCSPAIRLRFYFVHHLRKALNTTFRTDNDQLTTFHWRGGGRKRGYAGGNLAKDAGINSRNHSKANVGLCVDTYSG